MSVYSMIGGVLLLASGWLLARWMNRAAALRLARVEGMLALLRYTRTQVDSYSLSAPELFARMDAALLTECGLADGARPSSFEELVTLCGREDEEGWRILRKFAASFGKQYRREQVGECDACIEELEKRRATLSDGMSDGKRTRYTLCLTAAAVAVILLL